MLIFSIITGHISGCSTHVKTNDGSPRKLLLSCYSISNLKQIQLGEFVNGVWISFCQLENLTTPPAGPERTARDPLKVSIGVRPPSDCMKST